MSDNFLTDEVASGFLKGKAITKKITSLFVERRHKERRPQRQFFIAFTLMLIGSFIVLSLLNVFPGFINKSDFQVVSASTFEYKESISIDADLKMNFPDVVVEALENGIPLTIAVDIQVLRERPWWRNLIIKESRQRFELRYHPLTNVHEIKNIATSERYTFNSRHDAMAVLGTIRGAHLIDRKQLSRQRQYSVQMRILLDINRLPLALRQVASLSSDWRLESPWFFWKISDKPRSRATRDEEEQSQLTLELKKRSKIKETVQPQEQTDKTPIEVPKESRVNEADKNSNDSSLGRSDSDSTDSYKPVVETSE